MHETTRPSGLAGKRIVIACGHFTPELGYQEVDLARAFTRLGAQVRVVTSTAISLNARGIVRDRYLPGTTSHDGYEVARLPTLLTMGANVLGCNATRATAAFEPDHVILVGPGKLFGLDLFSPKETQWRRIAIIQDNSEDGRSKPGPLWQRRSRAILHRFIKRPAYRRVVRRADRVVLNVPETREIVRRWLRRHDRELLARKGLELRLGFDPERFYLDLRGREEWRQRYGVRETDVLLGTCTRATPGKRLEDVITTVSRLRAQGVAVQYVLAGLLDDKYCEKLHQHAADQPDRSAFHLLPVLRHEQMRGLFSACDLGFWPQAAITIQQAMGTGLPVVARHRPSVSHLIAHGRNGWYVEPGETLEYALTTAIESMSALSFDERVARRAYREAFNHDYLSYDCIALEIVDGLE